MVETGYAPSLQNLNLITKNQLINYGIKYDFRANSIGSFRIGIYGYQNGLGKKTAKW